MWEEDFNFTYKNDKKEHDATITLDMKKYDEALSEYEYGTDIDDYIISEINSQLKVELSKRSIVDYGSLTNDINDSYEEYKQEIAPDNENDD